MSKSDQAYATALRAIDRVETANAYKRMRALLDLRAHVSAAAFWKQVGLHWYECNNIHKYNAELLRLFAYRRRAGGFPIIEAMTDEDRQHYEALPERVAIFRGCRSRNKDGLSWSTSREVAMRFPFYPGYHGRSQPMLLSAVVLKRNIVFVTGARDEEELIVRPRQRRILGCDPITVERGERQYRQFRHRGVR